VRVHRHHNEASPLPTLNAVAETPEFPQVETTANPMPAPKESRTSVSAKEATTPANTAAHSTDGVNRSRWLRPTRLALGLARAQVKFSQRPPSLALL
jgi:hypothetical protein